MTPHLKRSRILKALTDRDNGATRFDCAEQRLHAVRVAIVLAADQAATSAGQAAALTAINTSVKCFGHATFVGDLQAALVSALPIGTTMGAAATYLGATCAPAITPDATHVVMIGTGDSSAASMFVRCWWDGWIAGIVPAWDERPLGGCTNPLAGVFSGALAIREVFASVLGYPRCGSRVSVTSLWEPGPQSQAASTGPDTVYLIPRLWLIGLGHLGQGFLWCLGLLPANGCEVVLQDDQKAGEENEPTGLLTTSGDIGHRKTQVAAAWLKRPDFTTRLIERRHYGDIPLLPDDPAIVITGLDEPRARIQIARAGFEYMIDAGLGHGAIDFEAIQLRILKKGVDAVAFWSSPEAPKNVDQLMQQQAYRAHESETDRCGTRTLADASVAVPFVGAAAGALTLTQLLRLSSMQTSVQMMQLELGAPAMAVVGATNPAAAASLGSIELRLR